MRSRGWGTAAFSLPAMARLSRLTFLVLALLLSGSWAGAASAATFFSDPPGDALPESAFPGGGGCAPIVSPYGELFGMACGAGSVSFTLHSPEGWAVDREEGKRPGTRVVYTAGPDTAPDEVPDEVRGPARRGYVHGLVAALVLLGVLLFGKVLFGKDGSAASRQRGTTVSAREYMTAASGGEGAFLITEGTAVAVSDAGCDEISEFRIQQKNGEVLHINLEEYSVPVRIGDEVLMISTKGNTIPCYIYIKNTKSMHQIYNDMSEQSIKSGCLSAFLSWVIIIGWILCSATIVKAMNIRNEYYAIALAFSVPVLMFIYDEWKKRKNINRNTETIDFFIDYIESTGIDIKTSDKFTFRMPVE